MFWSAVVGFILGSILGSFSKAAAERIGKGSTLWGRSYCPHCHKKLRWYDLFPVFSFLYLRGRCRWCHKNIPSVDLWAELALGLTVGLLLFISWPSHPETVLVGSLPAVFFWTELFFKILIIAVLALIFLIDQKIGLIPDIVIFPATLAALIYGLTTSALKSWVFYQNLRETPLAPYLLPPRSTYLWDNLQRIWLGFLGNVAAGGGAALLFALLIIGTRGKGMGWGDAKYVAFLGLALGFPNIVTAIFLAFFWGAIFSLILIFLKKRHFGQTIPFGPFLSLGALLTLLFGQQIINWYSKVV